MKIRIAGAIAATWLAGCTTTESSSGNGLSYAQTPLNLPVSARMLELFEDVDRSRAGYEAMGVSLPPENTVAQMAAQATGPLGSNTNPVRAATPEGQREYLSRLRCSNGRVPDFGRVGNVGPGIYRSIVDQYWVDCGRAEPGRVNIHIDMYHRHVENEAVPGFSIVPHGVSAFEPT